MSLSVKKRNLISLFEHERIDVGEKWDSENGCISERDLRLIERHQISEKKASFVFGYKQIKTTQWVGFYGLGEHCIEVLPKIGFDSTAQARRGLHHMINRGGILPIRSGSISKLLPENSPLLFAYMRLYLASLASEWRKGRIRDYKRIEENRGFLRGKLLVTQNEHENRFNRTCFYTSADEFQEDNPLSRILKGALRICLNQKFSASLSNSASTLMGDFENVGDQSFSMGFLKNTKTSRQHSRFDPLINLAKLIIQSTSPSISGGKQQIYSLMFDMNMVFERYIGAELKRAARKEGYEVKLQQSGRYLLDEEETKKGAFMLKPDIMVYKENKLVAIIDTKWKKLDYGRRQWGVSQGDIYQMYAYGKEFQCPRVILLYPAENSRATKKYLNGYFNLEIASLKISEIIRNPVYLLSLLKDYKIS
jgi:5-methylcytosine-specific restriction enzyme subunit McrC